MFLIAILSIIVLGLSFCGLFSRAGRLVCCASLLTIGLAAILAEITSRAGPLVATAVFLAFLTAGLPKPSIRLGVATAPRNTNRRPGKILKYPVAAATRIFAGTMAALDASGNLVPASDTAALRVVGVAIETIDNSSGAAGDVKCAIERGCFQLANSATEPLDQGDLEKLVFVEDDETVAATSTHKIVAGRVAEVDPDGASVWVEVGFAWPSRAVTLTSTNGAAAAAADEAALKAEAEKIGDDARALHGAMFG